MTETNTTQLYRIENPTIESTPDGVVSHTDLVGRWFTPNIDTAATYLRKATQTFGKDATVVDGARLIIADVPASDLESLHVSAHPIACTMDVEGDNYILPAEASYPQTTIPLDKIMYDLRGNLGKFNQMNEAKIRLHKIASNLGKISLTR